MKVKSHNNNLKHRCEECKDASDRKRKREDAEKEDKEDDDETTDEEDGEPKTKRKKKNEVENHTHCHCSKFVVTDDLMAAMSGGQPRKQYFDDLKKKSELIEVDELILASNKKEDDIKAKQDLKLELQRLRRAVREGAKGGNSTRTAQVGFDLIKSNSIGFMFLSFVNLFYLQADAAKNKTAMEKKDERERRRQELGKERQEKREELSLLFM